MVQKIVSIVHIINELQRIINAGYRALLIVLDLRCN